MICGFIQTERNLFQRERISREIVSRSVGRARAMSCKTPNQMISTNMVFDEVALGLLEKCSRGPD